MAKLSDIFTLQMGKTPAREKPEYWNDGSNDWVSIADLSSFHKYVGKTKETITEKAIEETGIKQVPPETVIMSFKLSLGKTAITVRPTFTNEAIMAFIPKRPDEILTDYIYYFFSGRDWSNGSNRAVMGTTLNKATLSDIDIVIPDIEEQKKVATNLNKIDDLINLRHQQLEKLDTLVKSQFIEMFGDISKEQYQTIKDVCTIVTDGTHQPPKFVSEGIPFLLVSNIANNEVTYETSKFITEEAYNELIKRTPIEVGDILLSTVGSYGHPAIVKCDKKFCFQRHIAYLKPNTEIIDSVFLYATILSREVQSKIDNLVLGVAQKTLNLSAIRSIEIPVPPMEEQKRFCEVFEQVDKSKFAIQQGLDKLETLKKSLMQEYFR